MEESMPDGDNSDAKLAARLRELGLELPKAPMPLGAYVTACEVGSLLFLSGMLPLVDGKLSVTGRLVRKPLCRAGSRGGADCGNERLGGHAAASR